MSTTLSANDYGVRMGNREYPKLPRRQRKKQPHDRSPEVIDNSATRQIGQQLQQHLLDRLPHPVFEERQTDRAQLFVTYNENINFLRQCRREALDLFRTAIETVFTHDLPDDPTCQAFIEQVISDSQVAFPQLPSLASAELGARPLEEIRRELVKLQQQAAGKLVRDLFSALDCLVDRSVIGLAHWTGPNEVRYHFFRRQARVIRDQRQRTGQSERQWRNADEDPNDPRRMKQIHEVRRELELACTLFHHKHDTVNAIATDLDNSTVPMPDFVQALACAIPGWMRSEMRVIDGYLIREQIFERETQQQTSTQIEYEEELIFGCEPAICLGPYVLIGWGPRDIAAMPPQQSAAEAADQRGLWFSCAVLAQLFCTLFLNTAPPLLGLALMLFLTSVGCLSAGLCQQLHKTGVMVSDGKFQLLLAGPLLLLAGWQSFWLPLGGVTLVLAPLLLLTGIVWLHGTGFMSFITRNIGERHDG